VRKVIPEGDVLAQTYRQVIESAGAETLGGNAEEGEGGAAEITIPPDLLEQVAAHQGDNPTDSWDEAIWSIAQSEEARYLQ
jgi:hypothetical protein